MNIPTILTEIKTIVATDLDITELRYFAFVKCTNCNWSGSLQIIKEIEVSHSVCSNCDCKTITKQ